MIFAALVVLGVFLAGFFNPKDIKPIDREQLEREVGGR